MTTVTQKSIKVKMLRRSFMKISKFVTALLIALISFGNAHAGEIQDELNAIKARLSQLEQIVNKQNEMINQQNDVIEQKSKEIKELVQNSNIDSGAGDGWFQNIEISGVAEVEAVYNDPDEGPSSSDIVLFLPLQNWALQPM